MSNLTSSAASGEAVSSGISLIYPPLLPDQYFCDLPKNIIENHNNQPPPPKKRRSLPGNPDPSAEVIALSPESLLATNRFLCEICNKGFQRDQNLQLHRRGHNLPWKLKQRTSKEIRKKVYICPEVSCIHHDPSRALGDLTGIKKHFCRKHGEKKWKCEKCSKKYAVQSDWKAHSKTCGTREYRCDCGTLFSRRDSFITHRAFCDALAEETARTTLTPSNFPFLAPLPVSPTPLPPHHHHQQALNPLALRQDLPPWLSCPQTLSMDPIFSSPLDLNDFTNPQHELKTLDQNPNPNPSLGTYQPIIPAPMSATALLQKAAQVGATMSNSKATFAQNMSPLESGKNSVRASVPTAQSLLIQDMMNSLSSSSPSPFIGSSFEDQKSTFCGLVCSKKEGDMNFHEEGMTRDFLGLRPISNSEFLNFSDHVSGHDQGQYHAQKSWQE